MTEDPKSIKIGEIRVVKLGSLEELEITDAIKQAIYIAGAVGNPRGVRVKFEHGGIQFEVRTDSDPDSDPKSFKCH